MTKLHTPVSVKSFVSQNSGKLDNMVVLEKLLTNISGNGNKLIFSSIRKNFIHGHIDAQLEVTEFYLFKDKNGEWDNGWGTSETYFEGLK